jgi:hypothetical protein
VWSGLEGAGDCVRIGLEGRKMCAV